MQETEANKFQRNTFNYRFQVLKIQAERLVGPVFLYRIQALINGEILALVPKQAIVRIDRYAWEKAERNYSYGESQHADPQIKDSFEKWIKLS